MTAVKWLQIKMATSSAEEMVENINVWFAKAKEIEKEQMIEFACKVAEASAEKYIQGKTTEQIAKEIITYKTK